MMRSTLIVLMLAAVSASQGMRDGARDIAAAIRDLSSSDSPLTVSGHVLFHEVISKDTFTTEYNIDGEIRNISQVPVIAFDVSASMLPEYDGGVKQEFTTDYFFESDVLKPGSQFSMSGQTPGSDTGPYHSESPARAANAEARVLFVEFLDGSTFGKSPWGDSLRSERTAQIALFHSLLDAYEHGNSPALSSAISEGLAKPSRATSVDARLRELQQDLASGGAEATAKEIRQFLSVAQSRKAFL